MLDLIDIFTYYISPSKKAKCYRVRFFAPDYMGKYVPFEVGLRKTKRQAVKYAQKYACKAFKDFCVNITEVNQDIQKANIWS